MPDYSLQYNRKSNLVLPPGTVFFADGSPGGGTLLYDVAKGNNGTVTGPTWQKKGSVWGLKLDNVDDYVSYPYAPFLVQSFTAFAWIKTYANQIRYALRTFSSISANYEGWSFGTNDDNKARIISHSVNGASKNAAIAASSLENNRLYFLCGTMPTAGGTARIYVNAEEAGNADVTDAQVYTNVEGCRTGLVSTFPYNGEFYFGGFIPNVILTQPQIQQWHQQTRPLLGV
jgi:hypothetical protein